MLELELERENVELDNPKFEMKEFRFDDNDNGEALDPDFAFLEEGTDSISGGIGRVDAVRFLREGCPGLGEG